MIKIPYEHLLERIKTTTGMTHDQIEVKLQEKMEQLSGLISKEGAAHILANELGIKSSQQESSLKISMLYAGLKTGEVLGKIIRKFDIREFTSGERSGKVGTFIIGDETGTIRVTCWHDQTKEMVPLQENDIILIKDASVRENRGALELHLNERTKLMRNPEGKTVDNVKQKLEELVIRKQIKALGEGDLHVEIMGTIVQVYDIKFYERCPICRKRIREQEVGFQCPEHGIIKPEYSYVMNVYLDDGSGNIRVVFFGNQIQQFLKKTDDELQVYRTAPEGFEKIKTDMLGELVKIAGKVTKNQMFERLEFVAGKVETNINPEEEIGRLQKELEKVQV
ncbi:MAG: OB-fold nucleic acid binding domain-containing protein [Nanoarchaeota archaeon]